jgi:hypothetical protein
MLELLACGLVLIGYFVGVAFYVNKTVNDYNNSLDLKAGRLNTEPTRQTKTDVPCLNCR